MSKILHIQKNKWYQLKISLSYIKPEIWRRFVIESNMMLPDFHKVIQTVMGWSNTHLHQFIINEKYYSEPDTESFTEYIDYSEIPLWRVLTKENQVIQYDYDFGDGWEHKIILEKIMTEYPGTVPCCLEGKSNCPPEDCGGPFGYEDLLRIISDPQDEEYSDRMEWLDGGFDPDYFNINEINELL